jgi:biopolymer transport protein ExbD
MLPVTPMLDVAFQLLAFFILTYRGGSGATRIDLLLPARAAAVAAGDERDRDRVADLEVRAEADDAGNLAGLWLSGSAVSGAEELRARLERVVGLLEGERVRVRLVADEGLRYEEAARLIGAIDEAGVGAIVLAETGDVARSEGPGG